MKTGTSQAQCSLCLWAWAEHKHSEIDGCSEWQQSRPWLERWSNEGEELHWGVQVCTGSPIQTPPSNRNINTETHTYRTAWSCTLKPITNTPLTAPEGSWFVVLFYSFVVNNNSGNFRTTAHISTCPGESQQQDLFLLTSKTVTDKSPDKISQRSCKRWLEKKNDLLICFKNEPNLQFLRAVFEVPRRSSIISSFANNITMLIHFCIGNTHV